MEKENLTNMSKETIGNLIMTLTDARYFLLTTVNPSAYDLQCLKQITQMIKELRNMEPTAKWLHEKMASEQS